MRLGKIYICSNEQNGFQGFRQWFFKNGGFKFGNPNQPKNIIDNGIQNKIIHQFVAKYSTQKSNH